MNSEDAFAKQIFDEIIRTQFDQRVMGNVPRSHYAEHMVAIGLGAGFKLASADWAPWDIDHESGFRIEVKQSAALQPWSRGKSSSGKFDIASRSGYWTDGGARWVEEPGRPADLFALCWHPVADESVVDHRDPSQWEFFLVPEAELPTEQKTISRGVVEARWKRVSFRELRETALPMIAALAPRRSV